MTLVLHPERARLAGARLFEAFEGSGPGIFGTKEMPEDLLPSGVERGSEEHLRFITFTVSIDYMRDAVQLWRASREAFESDKARLIFDPTRVMGMAPDDLQSWLMNLSISRKHAPDAVTWHAVASVLESFFDGSVAELIQRCDYSAPSLLATIRRMPTKIRYLSGPKIGPLWVRMLRDNCDVAIKQMEALPIPVDVHVARATLAVGAIESDSSVPEAVLYQKIRDVWVDACKGTGFYPMQFDKALWQQSRLGCTYRSATTCSKGPECGVADMCVRGRIAFREGSVEVDTSPLQPMFASA